MYSPESTIPSNIVILAKIISSFGKDGIPQIVFYDAGVGTTDSRLHNLRGGALGAGLDRNIQDLYTFLCLNYNDGDEVLLFGYSRGAYTVRSLVGMINQAGLVRRGHIDYVKEAYELYRSDANADSNECKAFRGAHGGRINITCLVCFDTVGSLGIPKTARWPISMFSNPKRYCFHDTELSDIVENAIHAMAIDEDRRGFEPTPMNANRLRGGAQVTQKYLPGYHGGVGGGSLYEKPLSENSLWFVIEEIERRGIQIGFDVSRSKEIAVTVEPRPVPRMLSVYTVTKTLSGKFIRPVESLDELHDSIVQRFCHVKSWRPPALKKFETEILDRGGNSSRT